MWFNDVVSMLVENFNVITPEQFRNREFDREKINVLLTFDDGYKSWVTTVLPILEENKIRDYSLCARDFLMLREMLARLRSSCAIV